MPSAPNGVCDHAARGREAFHSSISSSHHATRQAPSNSLFGNWSAFPKRAMCGPQLLFCHQEHRRPLEQQNEAADVGGVAGPHLCADRTPVQLEANKLEDVALNNSHCSVQCTAITQFMPTVPLAQPVEQQNEAADVGGVAGLHLSVDRTPVQLEANKLEKFGEGHSSETASFDAVLKDEAAPIELKGLLAQLVDRLGRIIRSLLVCR